MASVKEKKNDVKDQDSLSHSDYFSVSGPMVQANRDTATELQMPGVGLKTQRLTGCDAPLCMNDAGPCSTAYSKLTALAYVTLRIQSRNAQGPGLHGRRGPSALVQSYYTLNIEI